MVVLFVCLLSFGFAISRSDSSLFINNHDGIIAYLLVYVDDLLLIGNHFGFLQCFIKALSILFSLKQMRYAHHFPGVELISFPSSMFLSQHKHIRGNLSKFQMNEAKPVAAITLTLHDETAACECDATRHCIIIGSLQYLNLTRPILSFALNKLSQFSHKPNVIHFQQLKHLLSYLKSTVYHLLRFKAKLFNLDAYGDAGYAGNTNDHTSSSSYMISFGGNLVSWLSNKQNTVARSCTED